MTAMDLFGTHLPEQRKSSRFSEFWLQYPRKVEKMCAERAYHKAMKSGASEDELIAGAMRYARQTQGSKFIKHPATWLNKGCWSDEAPAPRELTFLDIVR